MNKKIWVIKFGGSLLSDNKARRVFLKQVSVLKKKHPLVLVHGGGPEIDTAFQKRGVKPKWVKGRRVTDAASMEIVESVLSGQVNKKLVGELNALGGKAVGISGRDGGLLQAKVIPSLGRVGVPVKGSGKILEILMKGGFLPVVSSVASDSKHKALNVNADESAAAVAVILQADRLIYLTDVAGVLDQKKKTIPVVHMEDVKKLIQQEVITGGMIPKILSCQKAIQKGVREIDIINGRAGLLKMKGTRLIL